MTKNGTASIILDNIFLLDRAIEIGKYCAAAFYAEQICIANIALEIEFDLID